MTALRHLPPSCERSPTTLRNVIVKKQLARAAFGGVGVRQPGRAGLYRGYRRTNNGTKGVSDSFDLLVPSERTALPAGFLAKWRRKKSIIGDF